MKKIIAIILAIILCFGTSLSIYASSSGITYIEDIKIGYGQIGKAALVNAGYTVWTDLDANEGGRGESVYLGYKETTNPLNAITDISLMNMNGGYSFGSWADEVNTIQKEVDVLVDSLYNTILEFRQTYSANSQYAISALEVLNTFIEDDSKQLLGDFLLDQSHSKEDIANMILTTNAQILCVAEEALALACAVSKDGKTFYQNLLDYKYTGEIDYGKNEERAIIAEAIKAYKSKLQEAYSLILSYSTRYGEGKNYATLEEYLASLTYDQQLTYSKRAVSYELAKKTFLGNTKFTLYDIAFLDDDYLSDEILEVFADCLSPGQIGVVQSVGLDTMLLTSYYAVIDSDAAIKNITDLVDELNDSSEKISVYAGVDRSLFSDPSTVAMTSDALRDQAAREGRTFGVDTEWEFTSTQRIAFAAAAGVAVCAAIAVCLFQYFGASTFGTATELVTTIVNYSVLGQLEHYSLVAVWSEVQITVTNVLIVVAIIVAVVLIIMTLVSFLVHVDEPEDINYTAIPRVIVDKKGNHKYVNYYAAKRIDANEALASSLYIYGDLNALNGKNEWFVLYYTKDQSLGSPLTTTMLVKKDGTSSVDGYASLHEFGSNAAVSLNKYNSGQNRVNVTAFVKIAETQAASVFSAGNLIAISSLTFLIGAVIAGTTAAKITKKKYWKEN